MPKVVIALNSAWNLVNFRAGLIKALVSAGYDVVAVAPPDKYSDNLKELGCRYVPIALDSKGINPFVDFKLLVRFFLILQRERADVYLGYTVKPNVFGSIAAHALGVPVVNNVAGLGSVFIKDGWLVRLVRQLYKLAFSRSTKVFFQNDDDLRMFVDAGLVSIGQADRIPGSGVDLVRFSDVRQVPIDGSGCIRFLLIARMLRDKGVFEYVEAARLLKMRYGNVEFGLLGFVDVDNPTAISRVKVDEWVAEGVVTYLGVSDDVASEIAKVDCVVLPSYREGVPRTLLEAAAMGRPIVTTDAVGCRDVVDHGVNGFLCKVKDAADLAEKMEKIILLSPFERREMGLSGRRKVELEFDERLVVEKYLQAVESVLRHST